MKIERFFIPVITYALSESQFAFEINPPQKQPATIIAYITTETTITQRN